MMFSRIQKIFVLAVAVLTVSTGNPGSSSADPQFRPLPDFFPPLASYRQVNYRDYGYATPQSKAMDAYEGYLFSTHDGIACYWDNPSELLTCDFPQIPQLTVTLPDFSYFTTVKFNRDSTVEVAPIKVQRSPIIPQHRELPEGSMLHFSIDVSKFSAAERYIPGIVTCLVGKNHLFACGISGIKDTAGFILSPTNSRLFGKVSPEK